MSKWTLVWTAALTTMAIASCSPGGRFSEVRAGIESELNQAGEAYFGGTVEAKAVGRTISGHPCGFVTHDGGTHFVVVSDETIHVMSENVAKTWAGLCPLNAQTPEKAPMQLASTGQYSWAVLKSSTEALRAREGNESVVRVAAMDAVRSRLRDPSSAKFSSMTVRGDRVCGTVDAKNGFGGRSGPQRFISNGAMALAEDSTPPEVFQKMWETSC